MKRLISWVLTLPIGVVVIALAVANRKPVTLALDPFKPDNPAFSVPVPLFLVVFAALFVGVILGGATVWLAQGRHRKAARVGRREAERLEAEKTRLSAQVVEKETALLAARALPTTTRPLLGDRRVA